MPGSHEKQKANDRSAARSVSDSAVRDRLRQLVDGGLRVHTLGDESAVHAFVVEQASKLLGAQRVLLALETATGLQCVGAQLPRGERADALLKAIRPWVDEARRTRKVGLRHGPAGAQAADQRSCLAAPLVVQREVLGCLYADIEGAFGRFQVADRDLLGQLARQAAAALTALRAHAGLQRQAAERNAALEQRSNQLAIIDSIQQGMAAALSFQAIVDLVGDKLREVFKTGDIGIRWRNEQTDTVDYLYEYEHGVRIHPASHPARPDSPVLKAFERREPLVINTRAETQALGIGVLPGTDPSLSCVFVPIIGGDRLLGAIAMENYEREHAFGNAEVRLLSTVATSMGLALENARLFNESQEALYKLEERTGELSESLEYQTAISEVLRVISESPTDVKPVFEAILDCATRLFGSPTSAVFSYDGRLVHLAATRNWSAPALAAARTLWPAPADPHQMTGRVIMERRALSNEDAWSDPNYDRTLANTGNWRRMVSAPMLKDGTPIGVIALAWPNPGKTPQRQIDLLKMFADQAVIAVENLRLINETREALERQTATAEVLKVIASSPSNVQPVFDAIVHSAARLFGRKTALRTVEAEGLLRRARAATS